MCKNIWVIINIDVISLQEWGCAEGTITMLNWAWPKSYPLKDRIKWQLIMNGARSYFSKDHGLNACSFPSPLPRYYLLYWNEPTCWFSFTFGMVHLPVIDFYEKLHGMTSSPVIDSLSRFFPWFFSIKNMCRKTEYPGAGRVW